MQVCSSYKCVVSQQQRTAVLVRAECIPQCSVLLCKTGSQHACKYTYEDFLFIQMCSEPTKMHCSTGQGRTPSPLFSAALQKTLTAGWCHNNYTSGDLFFMQV
ncbi:TPA: hypothetical protein ACH3X2_003221 [Trebouxia sp. C0005]